MLFVPPFGWDDQVSYRSRLDWTLALAESGIASLRMDLPGTGDSSGFGHDPDIVRAWARAVVDGVAWLRSAGANRVAVIAIGFGGLITARAASEGVAIDDLILWGVPNRGSELLRELNAFGRLERWKTGERAEDIPDGDLRAGGYGLTAQAQAELSSIDVADLLCCFNPPQRALVIARDGLQKGAHLHDALHEAGVEVRSHPGHGWGAMLARLPSVPPEQVFKLVNEWLAERTVSNCEARDLPRQSLAAVMGEPGVRFREKAIIFDNGGKKLFAVVTEPIDVPVGDFTVILYNAGGHRRIGPNRMWTDAARRWAGLGVPVIRVDLEGIGDADGDASQYRDVNEFYRSELVLQANAVLDLAVSVGLPERFLIGGICSGAFWAFQVALSDPRVASVVAVNPGMLVFDPQVKGRRTARRLKRLFGPEGLKRLIHAERKSERLGNLLSFALTLPLRAARSSHAPAPDPLESQLRALRDRGQKMHIAFCEDEPFEQELLVSPSIQSALSSCAVSQKLPCASHTLKPLRAQQATNAMLDAIVSQAITATQPRVVGRKRHRKEARRTGTMQSLRTKPRDRFTQPHGPSR
ncbi:MAG: alpha/beta fold hydrolase [Sphingomicrobium sp.]